MEWFAFFVIGLMLVQHWEVQRRVEDPGSWEETLQHYRRTVLWAFRLSVLFVFASVIVFVLDLFMEAKIGIINQTQRFLQSDAPVSVLIIAFFVGVARLVAERALDTQDNIFSGIKEFVQSFIAPTSLNRQSSIGNLSNFSSGPQRDAWFFWLCFSLVISILSALIGGDPEPGDASNSTTGGVTENTPLSTPSEPASGESSENSGENGAKNVAAIVGWTFAGIGASFYVALGYFVWVYMTLYLKLVQHHHFAGRAARLFLGRISGDQLPRQCTIIGPSYSGKTVFARQGGVAIQGGTTPPPRLVEPTSKVDIRTAPATSEDGVTLNVTTLDTPGENMGDHILLASTFRSDVLVLVLDLGMFDPKAMTVASNYSLANWHRLIRQDQDDEALKRAVNYMQGFHLATTRSIGDEFISPAELFKVRAFTLFLNRKKPEVLDELQSILDENNEHLQRLARDIGERFGVTEQECCCIAGNAENSVEAFHLMAKSTRGRLTNSFWPCSSDQGQGV